MRIAGILTSVALLAGAADARADVFVPADPPAIAAACASASADVVAAARQRGVAIAIQSGGAWSGLRVHGCPLVAAAPDGTAAIAVEEGVVVRRPGGAFGAPVATGHVAQDVAVAPGGWVIAGGVRSSDSRLLVTVVAPDGTARSHVLDRGGEVVSVRVEIDAQGTATVAWMHFDDLTSRYVMRATRAVAGVWKPTRKLGTGGPAYDPTLLFPLAVAVAPGGRSLIVWSADDGVLAMRDGGAPERISEEPLAGSVAAAVSETGEAIVVFAGTAGRRLVSERVADSGWQTQRLTGPAAPRIPNDDENAGPPPGSSAVVLAPDGRAAVAWTALGEGVTRVVAASGRAGRWSPPAPVSAVTRDADSMSLSLDAAGAPRLLWVERARLGPLEANPPNGLRGAVLAALASPPDSVAPALEARLPARTRPTRSGRFALRVPVRCSEACDVRIRLTGRLYIYAEALRVLRANRTTTIRVVVTDYAAGEFLKARRNRRPRLELIVSDRAGNVTRMARTVAVRVVDRPLIAFQVAPDHEFELFSRAGNRAVARFVNGLIRAVAHDEVTSERGLARLYRAGIAPIRKRYPEVDDTDCREAIFAALDVPLARAGFDANYVMD